MAVLNKNRRKVRGTLITWIWLVLTTLPIVACFSTGKSLLDKPLLERLQRPAGLIAYVGVDGNIYSINQDGENLQAVTKDAHLSPDSDSLTLQHRYPAWSPDGESLAYVAVTGTRGADQSARLYIASPDGRNTSEAFLSQAEFPFYLYWSPDSQWVSFLTSTGNQEALSLQRVSKDGGKAQELDIGQPIYWVWSPDSLSIIIHTGGAARTRPQAELAFLRLADDVKKDKLDLRPTFFQAPSWSPDGDALLLAIESPPGEDVLLLTDHLGMVEQEIIRFQDKIAFGWSPDGKHIAYLISESPESAQNKLVIMSTERPDEVVEITEEFVAAFFWAPDSQSLAYFVPVVITPGDETVSFGGQEHEIYLSLRTLDVSNGISKELAAFKPTQQTLDILPFFDQYQHSVTIWSPDSRNIVFAGSLASGETGIFIVKASGEDQANRIADGVLAYWSWK